MPNLDTASQVRVKGSVRIRIRDAKFGGIIREYHYPNLVCRGTKSAIAKLVSQQTTPDDYQKTKIWAIYAGSGATAPAITDDTLETVEFKKACDQPYAVDPSAGTVTVQMTMETGEGNGITYTEAGLFSRGSADDPNSPGITDVTMYCRRVHGGIAKTVAISIEYEWTLQIAI